MAENEGYRAVGFALGDELEKALARIRELEAQLAEVISHYSDELRLQVDKYRARLDDAEEERDKARRQQYAAESRVAKLEAALKAVEWIARPDGRLECAWCHEFEPKHDSDCIRQAALAHEAPEPAAMWKPEDGESLMERLDCIATELNHYAYGKDKATSERYPEWEEIAMAFGALERVVERLRDVA